MASPRHRWASGSPPEAQHLFGLPMQPITAKLLIDAVGCSAAVACQFAEPLAETCDLYAVDTPRRLAAFLAQTGHESQSFSRVVENLNYSAEQLEAVWPSRFTKFTAGRMARKPMEIANHVYGGRMGNLSPGDGWKYRGRGPIQVTGKANYEALTEGLMDRMGSVPDFVLQPDLVTNPKWGALAAGWYWHEHELNELADCGKFDRITKVINGGTHGQADRRARYVRALEALQQ